MLGKTGPGRTEGPTILNLLTPLNNILGVVTEFAAPKTKVSDNNNKNII